MSRIVSQTPILPKQPRVRDKPHMGFIVRLPCVVCLSRPVQVCHLRYADIERGKQYTAKGRKPSDIWVTPMCVNHHMEQHSMNEETFWKELGIDPISYCQALFLISGDLDAMEALVRQAHELFPSGQTVERQT